jgi:hypothetical protein
MRKQVQIALAVLLIAVVGVVAGMIAQQVL